MVLRKSICLSITLINCCDVRIVNAQINAILFDVACQVEQYIVLHVDLRIVGVHPEYIRKLSAGSTSLEKCPIVVPVNYLDLYLRVTLSCPVVADFLDSCLLVSIPDVNCERA